MIPSPRSPSTLARRATAQRAAMGVTGISGPGVWAHHGGDGPLCALAPFDVARAGKPRELRWSPFPGSPGGSSLTLSETFKNTL